MFPINLFVYVRVTLRTRGSLRRRSSCNKAARPPPNPPTDKAVAAAALLRRNIRNGNSCHASHLLSNRFEQRDSSSLLRAFPA
jgi:hypothetical protein